MISTEFAYLVKDLLANCYDNAALETHPLVRWINAIPSSQLSRAEILREIALEAIQALRPPTGEPASRAVEWRPYQILHGRYIEDTSLAELQGRLALSARQLRREHGRALAAVASWIWDHYGTAAHLTELQPPLQPAVKPHSSAARSELGEEVENGAFAFPLHVEILDPIEVVRGALQFIDALARKENCRLEIDFPDMLPPVSTDRVILRQILLALCDYALQMRSEGVLKLGVRATNRQVEVRLSFHGPEIGEQGIETDEALLDTVKFWASRVGAVYGETISAGEQTYFTIALPVAFQTTILVVDDHEQAIRMYERYLRHTPVRVVGIQDSAMMFQSARQSSASAIILDIMMPAVDGWEILQSLKSNPETQTIPVIVCSVWNVPDLAFSLGAADFLKKPVMQKDLLAALARLQILNTPAGSFPEGNVPPAPSPDV